MDSSQPTLNPIATALEDVSSMSRKDVFLLEIYKQCSSHLGRHVSAMWQCLAVLVAFGASVRTDTRDRTLDYGITLVVVLCTWLIASSIDASAWFNRNIAIVRNIERLFLESRDVEYVHPFFAGPPRDGKIIMHFRIQIAFAITLETLALGLHFGSRVADGFALPLRSLEVSRMLPYLISSLSALGMWRLMIAHRTQQRDADRLSPGRDLATSRGAN